MTLWLAPGRPLTESEAWDVSSMSMTACSP
jgi:hypothetical protein